jgi:hypothetical protein
VSMSSRLEDSFGRPDAGLFPEEPLAPEPEPQSTPEPYVEAAGAQIVTEAPLPISDDTGWESVESIPKPGSLRARIEMQDEDGDAGSIADEEEPEKPVIMAPRHEANVTPFPGTVLHRAPEPAPSDLLRGSGHSADVFDEIASSGDEAPGMTVETPANQDALADAVQSALRNIYGGYSEQPEDGADQGFTVADALAGPDNGSDEPIWSENRAQSGDWRAARAKDLDSEPDSPEEQESEGTLDYLYGRRAERAPAEMSLNEYAARASIGDKWRAETESDDQRITPFPTRREPEFQPEAAIIRGGGAGAYFHEEPVRPSMDQQWRQTPYAAPQNARGSITPTYVPATATPADQLPTQGPDSGHLLGAAGLGLIGGIALAGVLAVFVFNSFVDDSGQTVNDPKTAERLNPPQVTANLPGLPTPAARPAPETTQTVVAATSEPQPAAPEPAAPESDGKPKLTATTAIGVPDNPIKLNIGLANAEVGDALVSLKGLPKEARLSTGIDVGGGQWLLPPGRLKDLTVTAPGNAVGSYQLEAQLLKDDAQTSISDAVPFTLSVGASAAKPAPVQIQQPAAAKPASDSRLALLPDEAPLPETDFLTQILIRDGNKKMREGDIAGARKLYEQAAQSGNAEAALAMGRSYDPTYFEKLTVKSGKPDPATAFEWYKRALDGGLVTAKVKIDALKQWLQR